MTKRIIAGLFLAALFAAQGGCSTLRTPGLVARETATQRFGPYCEQLGNLKGTPGFDACVKKMHITYQ